jgi:RNA 2',3'-cyclic 3'-phosphodiesterase
MARSRLFLAVSLATKVVGKAAALQLALGKTQANVNWVSRESLHLTLVFLGEVDDREQHAICKAAAKAVEDESPVMLRVSGVGAFPSLRRPKVIWAGITEGAEELIRIQKKMADALVAIGCYRHEDRPYVPHLTLGRAKDEEAGNLLIELLEEKQEWDGGETLVSEVGLYCSELRRCGPEYTLLGRIQLGS